MVLSCCSPQKNYNCDGPFCPPNCAFACLHDDEQGETTPNLLDY